MSAGIRWDYASGVAIAKVIINTLANGVEVMGSVRRRSPDVGDLDLIAPMPPYGTRATYDDDPLFRALNANVSRGWVRPPLTLFGGPAAGTVPCGPPKPWFDAGDGYKPGFKLVQLVYYPDGGKTYDNEHRTIPVQIHRYAPENRGWITVMRTGPAEFNPWLLWQWKRAFGIPEDRDASRDGYLIDAAGNIVPVPTEADVFRLARIEYYTPEQRSRWKQRR